MEEDELISREKSYEDNKCNFGDERECIREYGRFEYGPEYEQYGPDRYKHRHKIHELRPGCFVGFVQGRVYQDEYGRVDRDEQYEFKYLSVICIERYEVAVDHRIDDYEKLDDYEVIEYRTVLERSGNQESSDQYESVQDELYHEPERREDCDGHGFRCLDDRGE